MQEVTLDLPVSADTAIVCKPAYPRTFHDLEIREILAKPRVP